MKEIYYPPSCEIDEIFNFCNQIEACHEKEMIINFSKMGRIEPFAMAYVAKYIRNFYQKQNVKIRCRGHKTKDYAANMAFFRAFGLEHGRAPNCVSGNNQFIPYTTLRLQTITDEAIKDSVAEQEKIEQKSSHLARILTQQNEGDLFDALTFSIREIMRNSYEHSQSKSLDYCAQFWPSYSKVEIALTDNGIGLKESLKINPHIKASNHSDAIQLALMPAVSSKNYKGARINKNDPWHNSGFGLYMISRICRLGGSFLICSGNHGIKLDENKKTHFDLSHNCNGVAVRMVLNTSRLSKLKTLLERFRDDGYAIAKQKNPGVLSASTASQMLSKDFSKSLINQ